MKKNKYIIIGTLLFFAFIIMPVFVFSQADPLGANILHGSVGGVGLQSDLESGVANVIKAVLAITGTVFLVLTITGGLIWMTASGNDEKIAKAKKIIIGAVIGLAITLSAYTITSFVATRVGGAKSAPCASLGGFCPAEDVLCQNGDIPHGNCPVGKHCCKVAPSSP